MSSGRPSCRPSARTSSLNRSRSGSISSKAKSSGSPPTLWCSLIVAAGPSRRAAAFDHVGIERALGQELGALDLGRLVGKALDEGVADPPPLFLRIGHAGQRRQELVLGLDDVQVGLEVVGELADDRLLLVLPQQAVVDQDARELRADRLGQQARPRPTNRRRRTARRSPGRRRRGWRIGLDRLARRNRPAATCRGSRRRL